MKKRHPIHDPVLKRIAELYRAERKARRISQTELTNKLNMSQPHLSKIENAQAFPTLIQWMKFLELFGLPSNIVTDEGVFNEHLVSLKKRAVKLPWSNL